MLEKYQIKIENNEEVLYIYLNYNYEFGKFNFFNNINNYIKQSNIKFKGKKIVLVTAGIAFASFVLNKPISNDNNYNNPQYVTSIIFNNFDDNLNIISQETYNIKNDNKEEVTNNNSNNSIIKQQNDKSIKYSTINNTTIKSDDNIVKKEDTKQQVKIDNEEDTKQQENFDNKENTISQGESNNIYNTEMITLYRSNGQIINIDLEEYLIGVVAAEMPASFNIEALKAQSILARTYALKSKVLNKKLTDTVATQCYYDNSKLESMWGKDFNKYYNKIKQAVESTKGITITYNNNYIEAVYHSTSNGYTENSVYVWGNEFPYLKSVDSHYDENVNGFKKETILSYEEISNKLNIPVTINSIVSYDRNESNRVKTIYIDNNEYNGTKFRALLGLRSTDFELELNDEYVTIVTKGYGHGVGMSQYGANEMAKLGYNYGDIINHYYPGVTIK